MLRSTKKEVKEKIRAYILDCMDFSNYIGYDGYPDKEPESRQDRVLLCRDIFREGFLHPYNMKRCGNSWGCFREWLCGLPSVLTVAFSYYDARQLVREWLEQTADEANNYDDAQVWDKYLHLIAREFFAMVGKAEKESGKKAV